MKRIDKLEPLRAWAIFFPSGYMHSTYNIHSERVPAIFYNYEDADSWCQGAQKVRPVEVRIVPMKAPATRKRGRRKKR